MKSIKYNIWKLESVHSKKLENFEIKKNEKFEIQFTQTEKDIISLLKEVNKKIEKKKPTLRIAGGWVRDKILGKDSKDLDICLDSMTGKEFCEQIEKFQKEKKLKTRSIGIIKANEEKSKHLETATTFIYDEPIDFVNMRKETYSEDSRIPTIEFGTPKEDALRRDFTINSLFYNLDKDEIEDYTNNGISDLKDEIIRTPLDPKKTFHDDPLRLIRCVRFACNLHFTVHQDIFEALKDKKISESLFKKVSRERVGIEMNKIMDGPDPIGGLALLDELGIKEAIFCVPQIEEHFENQFKDPTVIKWKDFSLMLSKMKELYHLDKKNRKIVLFACLLYDLEDINSFIVHSLKLPLKLSQEVTDLRNYSKSFENCENLVQKGNWIRGIKDLWESSLYLNKIIYDKKDLKSIEYIKENKLDKMINMKPLLNGNEVAKLLNILPSKKIGEIITKMIDYQILNFEKVTKKEMEEIILKWK